MFWTLVILSLLPLGLYGILKKRKVPDWLWWVSPTLLFVGMAMLATAVGDWLASIITISGQWAWLGSIVMILLIVGAILDLKDKRPDGLAKTAFVAVPFLAMIVSGPIADEVQDIVNRVAGSGVQVTSDIAQ